MKNLFLFALLAMGTMFISCGNDDDELVLEETFVATIDGNSFEATTVEAEEDDFFGEPVIFIRGTEDSSGDAIGMLIPLSTPKGFSTAIDETDAGLTFHDADENIFFTVGQLTITENDADSKMIAGTFNFTATDDSDSTNIKIREITNGKFSVIYE